ncbi:MAG: hypothetical protein UT09_C0017G0008 [Parcubacteria group bacterium GW2011_GWF2_38_8]|nr:MAG: hypothetical protein UT09_C0017G0008 [Parcubacteria group bacterium GW2011_GWF2_38_8]
MINVKYDDSKVKEEEIILLSNALKNIVSNATSIKEVFVYADSPRIKINVAPIEVFVEISTSKVQNKEKLFQEIRNQLLDWKKKNSFAYPVTITLTPVNWKFEVGI